MRRQQSGFTLIELIIVVVILGILAVTAAPRFLDLSDDAGAAAAEGVQGAVESAADTARAQFLVSGSSGTTVTIDGLDITVENAAANRATTANGYPVATADGIGRAVELSSQWSDGVNGTDYLFIASPTFPADNAAVAALVGARCVSYTLTNDEPTTTVGVIPDTATTLATLTCS